ncbi:MAG: hypothetical protein PHN21_04060 [Erysipelotrichaceae bacterium]|nr:hypothetical protein [Erysipelotrichaceae bacterium]
MEFTYTLTKKEYTEYYHYFVLADKKVKSSRRNFIYLIPIIVLVGLFVFQVRIWYVYLLVLLLSPLWFILANYIFNSIIVGQMVLSLKKKQADRFSEISVELTDLKKVIVSTIGQTINLNLVSYMFTRNLLVLNCDDNEVVLLPIRLFKEPNEFRNVLKILEQ